MNLLVFAASGRINSLNRRLAALAARMLESTGHQVTFLDYHEFDSPFYDGDLEEAHGVPEGSQKFIGLLRAHDAWVLSSPEYNHSIPGSLKNLIDWGSRVKPLPFTGKPTLLLSASPSLVGGNRGLWHLRQPLEALGTLVYPEMFSLAAANKAFVEDGSLLDSALGNRLGELLAAFTRTAEAIVRSAKEEGK